MSTFMNGNGANGLKIWQDYVLGLDHMSADAKIRIAAEPRPDAQPGVRIRPIERLSPRTGTGFKVRYRLNSPGEKNPRTGESQEFDVELPKVGGRYRLDLLIDAEK